MHSLRSEPRTARWTRRGPAWLLIAWLGTAAQAGQDTAHFPGFLAEFRQALDENNAGRVASLTQLPFLFEGVPRDRAGFLAIYPRLFDAPTRRCLTLAKPLAEDGARVISCKPIAFYFRRVNGAWRLVEFGADGEDMP